MVLIGNKCDLEDERVITRERGEAIAKEFGVRFYETSAKADIGVLEAFDGLVDQVCDRTFAAKELSDKNGTGGRARGASSTQNVNLTGGGAAAKPKSCC
jgi:Ras-related protein Rab-8A